MPIKSKAQRRTFAELLVEGKITPETFEEWNRGAGDKELPERLHPEKKAAGKTALAVKRKTTKRKSVKRKAAKRKTAAKSRARR